MVACVAGFGIFTLKLDAGQDWDEDMTTPYLCLSAMGMLGYGLNEDSLRAGLLRRPNMIGADAGSTDAGPQKLGGGYGDVSRATTLRDLSLMIKAGKQLGVPVVIGSVGGSGGAPHMDWTWEIVREIAGSLGAPLRVALIHAEIDKEDLKRRMRAGKVSPLGPVPMLDEATVDATVRVVGQMGVEPIMAALDRNVDLVLAGRACDAAIFAGPAIRAGIDPGLAWHMGELLECGAMSAQPGSANDCLLATMEKDRFIVEPINPARSCTPLSVASHSLYERSHPTRNHGPGHILDVSAARFEALDARRVAVYGSQSIPHRPVRIKLEGSGLAGYRTMMIGGIRDPIALQCLDDTLNEVKQHTRAYFDRYDALKYDLRFIVYGRDGVMGRLEPTPVIEGHEVGLVLDVVAESQEASRTVCAYARAMLQHHYYPGIKATGANIAFPTAPSDTQCGAVYRFTVHHLVEVDDPAELFRIETRNL